MIKFGISTLCLILLFSALWAQSPNTRQENFNVRKGIAIDGYDPVSYFSERPLEGRSDLSYKHQGITYLFASTANLAAFKSDPTRYEPAFGGWCAYAMGETGEKVKIDPGTFKILDGKLYLFYNFWGNNTLNKWNQQEQILKVKAEQHWKKLVPQ